MIEVEFFTFIITVNVTELFENPEIGSYAVNVNRKLPTVVLSFVAITIFVEVVGV